MRVADYVVDALYRAGARHAFGVTGGMIMHLTDAVLAHGKQKFVACHHETPAVMAADAYGRYTGQLGVAYVTAGPGALNTLTGVAGAYVDSAPVVIVAGQSIVAQATEAHRSGGPGRLRQYALQGYRTLPIFEEVTKDAIRVDDPSMVQSAVEYAIWQAKNGRPGPVWLELPVDVQGAQMPEISPQFYPPERTVHVLTREIAGVARLIRSARRPVVLVGAGVRAAKGENVLNTFLDMTGLPVMTSRLGMDLVAYDHPGFIGHPGTYGDRPANFAVQNADLILILGCRLGMGLVGYGWKEWGQHATKVMIDLDTWELRKESVRPDIPIHGNVYDALVELAVQLQGWRFKGDWLEKINDWRKRYPVDLPEYADETKGVNSYHFMRVLSEEVSPDAIFVVDTGSCFHVHAQAFKVQRGQRHIITGGISTMGYWPAALGPAFASNHEVYCVTGDGSLQMHLQELATLMHHRPNVKLIVFNNNGYLLIRHTQANFLGGRFIGTDPEHGVSFPSLAQLALVYGLNYVQVDRFNSDNRRLTEYHLRSACRGIENVPGPAIIEVHTPAAQLLQPRVASEKQPDGSMKPKAYDDMFPFLPRDEYEAQQVWKDHYAAQLVGRDDK